jgi:NO-binding membrane sensor protein with MHYT domain
MALVMDRPRSVAAVYVYEPDLLNLGILAGTVAAGVALYVSGRRRGGGAPAEAPQPTAQPAGRP